MRTVHSVSAILLLVALGSDGAHAKPISETSPEIFAIATTDESGPALRLTLGGISADFLRGDVRVTAELTTGLKARVFVVYDKFHFTAETTIARWRVTASWGSWFPLTNLARLAENMQLGMEAAQGMVSQLPELIDQSDRARVAKAQKRMRPWGRPLRLASEALDSVWNANPGWTVGVTVMGRVMDPLGLRLDPLYEVAATATLIF